MKVKGFKVLPFAIVGNVSSIPNEGAQIASRQALISSKDNLGGSMGHPEEDTRLGEKSLL